MSSFLQQLSGHLRHEHGDDLSDLTIVFPTRRAGLFFRQQLASGVKQPVWAPEILTIQDFIGRLSTLTVADQVTLLFILFHEYRKYFPEESFDRFYPWGELMLQDFADIDRYHADALKVFGIVNDLREIDQEFQLAEEELEKLRSFWISYFSRDPSKLKAEFINTWKHLGDIYSGFHATLLERGIAYEGLAFRKVAESLESGKTETAGLFGKVVFAGFYALTKTEEIILQHFIREHKAEIYWDADSYYVDNPQQEAGTFFRKGSLTQKNITWKQDHFASLKRTLEITGIPLLAGQAKYAGQLLCEMMNDNSFIPEETAVVLPDENLLFPLLNSLPENLTEVNVTMGYPLRVTPMYHLFESLISLNRNRRMEGQGNSTFYFRDVLDVLDHPYIRLVAPEEIRNWMKKYNARRKIRLHSEELTSVDSELFKLLFNVPGSGAEVFSWLSAIIRLILAAMNEQDYKFHRLESEIAVQFYTQLSKLQDALMLEQLELSLDTIWFIFREIIQAVRIPFAGEPLKGLQVMGFLEARVLDFKRVILLSVNEDILPASGNKPSFIPFNIRKAFSLPTFEDQHAVSAYHFYRLLQRTERIHLIYNTESKSVGGGDKSRFLLQIEHELAHAFKDQIRFSQKVVSTGFAEEKIDAISVRKTDEVLSLLEKYLINTSSEAGQKSSASFSPSALNTYLHCPLSFYFKYIAGLKEEEDTHEYLEASGFGEILHGVMQKLYHGYKVIQKEDFLRIADRIDPVLDSVIEDKLNTAGELEGRNFLLRNVLKDLIQKIISADRDEAPLSIIALEHKLIGKFTLSEGREVMLNGIADRIDIHREKTRVLDYKTGRVAAKFVDSMDELFHNPANKEQFQALFYARMVKEEFQANEIYAGIMPLRTMSQGIKYLNKENPVSDEMFREFESRLRKLIHEILDPLVSFVQTSETDRCIYCPYKGICHR